jgi:hypothetical protein
MAPHIVSRSNFLLLLFVFLLFLQPFLYASGQNAQIAGTVTDPSKAVNGGWRMEFLLGRRT